MFKFKKLKSKIIAYIGIFVLISLCITSGILYSQTSKLMTGAAYENTKETAYNYSNFVEGELNNTVSIAENLSNILKVMKESGSTDRSFLNNILKETLEKNEDFIAVWTCWEPNKFDGKDKEYVNSIDSDYTGRVIPYWYRNEGSIKVEALKEYDIQSGGDFDLIPKDTKSEYIMDPYWYEFGNKKELMISLGVPIEINGEVLGVLGIDMSLESFQQQVKDIKPYGTGYVSIIANNGTYVAHKKDDNLGKDIGNTNERKEIKEFIKEGKEHSLNLVSNSLKKEVHRIYVPIEIGNTSTPWSFSVSIPVEAIVKDVKKMRNISIVTTIVSMILLILIINMISDKISKPILDTTEMLKEVAQGEGDLTKRLKVVTEDEVGELAKWFNIFIENVNIIIARVKESAELMASSSAEIGTVMDESARGIEQMAIGVTSISDSIQGNASIVEETTASIEEMASSSNVISEEAEGTFNKSKEILKLSNEGAKEIDEVVKTINEVEKSTGLVYESILDLNESSKEIGDIISIITGISEQTNLLALNAAIEAARAGEHGKGFAVVAEEVRKLAEESKVSAYKIEELIDDIQSKSQRADKSIKEGTTLVKVGVDKATKINDKFDDILNAIYDITNTIEVVSRSSQNQAGISQDMTSAMNEISSTTNENASEVQQINAVIEEQVSSFEEISASVDNLSNVAQELKNHTDRFKV
ncbi:methyl-accepting chemotaxis protein [Tepidibacter hydrothermalis]|uniref:Methyl-accepting chemotaxis protein n=1 Tax=Tepidibacter hydrothermalis TaxID=3036126 RepID=A0ABY8EEP2_9FIRM|nr:methyl-accepting chemotaxis protein [Tepidibacter hydrothermalis]WFD11424.1 methyl-accepting chemotaxis protein [Tepidibacter hydrothermalis]